MTMSKTRSEGSLPVVSLSLPVDVTAPAVARQAVRATLASLGFDDLAADDVLLATSELVTNAFEHGEKPDKLEVEYSDDRLTLRVFDSGSGRPKLKEPSPMAARSRGLQLVHALSEDWGHELYPGGKYVWAVFSLRRAAD
ncbi:ATP-binding protein [Amycolatopsis regifaucium]|uniref:Anti-sigma regulatory factor n=1 Tax=Amycolatopsis regifaucium TaxID=546365 RepID=A0A154MBR9_9PSEU|nr:ATP-binding protein [Amycolatopsis regifaucium]KZB81730.1 anti-sigma regulatory factor [Amycolatopsis regifaucium]OKA06203.1 anti-sigma regulatory factor [Amycolatopsis regifaucium]SFG69591.1 Anti-sigma regulatory factor (Ser/Thr protein kinase) [Amycolatopsis regifaucium]